jgi:hypothetical protein
LERTGVSRAVIGQLLAKARATDPVGCRAANAAEVSQAKTTPAGSTSLGAGGFMHFHLPHPPLKFEIPDDWWTEAGAAD